MNHREASALAKSLRRDGVSIDEVLGILRESGVTIVGSIRVIADLEGLSIADAKEKVHFSAAWADRRVENDLFHEKLIRVAKEVAEEIDNDRVGE